MSNFDYRRDEQNKDQKSEEANQWTSHCSSQKSRKDGIWKRAEPRENNAAGKAPAALTNSIGVYGKLAVSPPALVASAPLINGSDGIG